MRILAFIEFTAVLIGILGTIAGHLLVIPKGFYVGVFLVGAGIALGGLESVFTRRMGFRVSDDNWEAYAGAPAIVVGLMALIVGAGLMGTAYVLNDRLWRSTVQYLTNRPAPVLLAAGLLLVGMGVLMMLNWRGRLGVAWTFLVYVPRSAAGFILAVGGLIGIGLAGWDWFYPSAFDRYVQHFQQADWSALERWWRSVPGPRS